MNKSTKAVSGVFASAVLATSGMAVIAAPLASATEACADEAAMKAPSAAAAPCINDRVTRVYGAFSYDQNALTPSSAIREVFAKAAATLCQATPLYQGVDAQGRAIEVSVNLMGEYVSTITEANGEVRTHVAACACASNAPGGGAVANAEVSGTTIESLAGSL